MATTGSKESVVIVSACRTPLGGFQGVFAGQSAAQLGSVAVSAAVERSGLAPETVEEVLLGCVLPAGQGQAPARQAALGAGLPLATGCTTVNKMCGSGMKATMLAADALRAGSASVVVAGGMESMTGAPYLIPRARGGLRMGHGTIVDHMFLDGLEDAYDKGRLMGTFAEDCAGKYGFTREEQDAWALRSLERAKTANEDGSFDWETAAVVVTDRKGNQRRVDRDEQPFTADLAKIPSLRPAFRKDGTVTAANSSSISDGAAALVLTTEAEAERRGLSPLARVVAQATHAQEPGWFTTAPVAAISKVLEAAAWDLPSVDLFEINEAFAVVAMAAVRDHGLDPATVNVHGGACALGHPIGASGARILVTLLAALRRRGLGRGVATLCIGGGEATAMAIETL